MKVVAISFSRRSPDPGIKLMSRSGRWILYHCATWVYSRDKMDNISDICNPMGGIECVYKQSSK